MITLIIGITFLAAVVRNTYSVFVCMDCNRNTYVNRECDGKDGDCGAERQKLREHSFKDKKLSYRGGTVRCVVSVEILPVATQQ